MGDQIIPDVSSVTKNHFCWLEYYLFDLWQTFSSSEEINFLLMCCDQNHDGKIDYIEFTERFHNPAKDIGFNLAVLLTNLSEHMPNDPRLVEIYYLIYWEFIEIKIQSILNCNALILLNCPNL